METPTPEETSRRLMPLSRVVRWPTITSVFMVVGLVYLPSLGNFFASDDFQFVAHAQLNASEPFLTGLVAAMRPEPGMFYRPVVTVVNWLNYLMAGANPVGWHVVNLLLHLIATALVIALMRRLIDSWWGSLAAGLLFGVHFIHAEPVIWVAGRTTLLASVGVLAAVNLESVVRKRRWGWQRWLALLFAIAGVFAKETAVVLPILLLVVPPSPYSPPDLPKQRTPVRLSDQLRTLLRRGGNVWPYWVLSGAFIVSRTGSILTTLTDQTYRMQIGLNVIKNFAFLCVGNAYPLPFRAGLEAWNQWHDASQSVSLLQFVLSIPHLLVGAFVAVIIWGILLVWGNCAARRATAWMIVAALPILFFKGTGERLLYLSSTGAVCAIVATVTGWWAGLDRYRTVIGRWVCLAVIPVLILLHMKWLSTRQDSWHDAAALSEAVVVQLRAVAPTLPPGATVRFTDLPDNIEGAWVFRSSIEAAFALYAGRPDVTVLTAADSEAGASTVVEYSWKGESFELERNER